MDAGTIKGKIELDYAGVKTGMAGSVAEVQTGTATLRDLCKAAFGSATQGSTELTAAVAQNGQALRSLGSVAGDVRGSLASVFSTAVGTALGSSIGFAVGQATSLVGSLVSIGEAGIKLSAQAESTSLALKTMIGSADLAQALLKDLRTFANATPFEFPELANAAKQLLAMGINSTDVVNTLRMLGDVSSGLGQPIGEMAYLFGQIRSQGRAMTQDLNQFAGRGVPIYSELARVLKTDELGVRSLAETGQISFDKINAAFASMTAEGGKFFNMTTTQAETAMGLFSTLQDSIGDVEKQIGDALTTGTDGKQLLKDITAEIDKMKPAVVALAVAAASGFRDAMPALKATAEYLQTIAAELGIIDLNKLSKNPYNPTGGDAADPLAGATNSAASTAALNRVQNGIGSAASQARTAVADIADSTYGNAFGIQDKAAALAAQSENATKLLVAIMAARSKGKAVSDEQFNAAKEAVASNLKLMGELQESLNKAVPFFGDFDMGKDLIPAVQSAAAKIRAAQVDSGKALGELGKAAADRQKQTDAAKAVAQAGDWAAGDASPSAAAATAPGPTGAPAAGGQAGAPGTPGAGAAFDVAKAVADARVAALQAAGKDEEAAMLKARQQRDQEFAKVNAQSDAGTLTVKQSVDASLAIKLQYESSVTELARRFAKQRANEAERQGNKTAADADALRGKIARVAEYQTQTTVAELKIQGRAFDAEMVAFDAAWKRRIDAAKDGEERYSATVAYQAERREKIREEEQRQATGTANATRGRGNPLAVRPLTLTDAQKRVRDGQAGSGERELARLDLRDVLGKPLSDADGARRTRLGQRFGREQGFPSAFDGASAALRPATGSRPTGSAEPQINVSPKIEVNEAKIAAACAQAIEPIVDRKLARLESKLRAETRARAHLANVSANV